MSEMLNFIVEKSIWLALDDKKEILGWTTEEPKFDNGYINEGTILMFNSAYPRTIEKEIVVVMNFIMICKGSESKLGTAEFLDIEIIRFTDLGVFKQIKSVDIQEINVTPGGTIVDHDYILTPHKMYIVMGTNEAVKSAGLIKVGEKVSIDKVLEYYCRYISKM